MIRKYPDGRAERKKGWTNAKKKKMFETCKTFFKGQACVNTIPETE